MVKVTHSLRARETPRRMAKPRATETRRLKAKLRVRGTPRLTETQR
jgi:hypothetical protein